MTVDVELSRLAPSAEPGAVSHPVAVPGSSPAARSSATDHRATEHRGDDGGLVGLTCSCRPRRTDGTQRFTSMDPEPRFWAKVAKDGSGCWVWTAGTGKSYGRFNVDGRGVLAHRFAYEMLVGPIPEGGQWVFAAWYDGARRMFSAWVTGSRCAGFTHRLFLHRWSSSRPHGHPYDEANTGFSANRNYIQRVCLACGRINQRRYAAARKERAGSI